MLTAAGFPAGAPVRVGLLAAGACLVGLADTAVSRQGRRERAGLRGAVEADYRHNITLRLIDAVDMLEGHHREDRGRFRANVMLIDPDRTSAMIAYNSRGYSPEELLLEWTLGEGSVGKAWAEARMVEAPANGVALDGTDQSMASWSIPHTHYDCVRGVAMVVSIPLFDEVDPEQVIGVISLDDTLPPGRQHRAIVASFKLVAEKVEKSLHEVRRTLNNLEG